MEDNNIPSSGEHVTGEPYADESPANKPPNPTRDRLSELPDLAIVHILSHMYIEEAARTSVLSKRFNSLWNSVSALNFSDENSGKVGDRFISFVDTALGFHRRRHIEKFSVKFSYDAMYQKVIDRWIKFASLRQVKSLHLNLIQNRAIVANYEHKLPRFLYNNEKVVELVTSCCKLAKNGEISWSSLKLLSLTQTKLNEGLLSRVLAGCPVLETLELRDWTGFDRLKISSVGLRVLRLVEERSPKFHIQPQDECLFEISGPNLVSLEVSGLLYRTRIRLSDVGSLVSATMNFEVYGYGSKCSWVVRFQDIAREVLESLSLVKSLTVGGWWFKVLSTYEAYNLSSPLSKRRSLTLCIPVIRWDHLGIASLLHSSPFLERLVLKLSYCSDMCASQHTHASFNNRDEEYYWTSWSTTSKCSLLHLRAVKVVDFRASSGIMKPLFQFLQFLLVNSKILEEVVIETSRYVTQAALDEALQLISVPTVSPDAVVHFEPPHLWVDPLYMCQISAPL